MNFIPEQPKTVKDVPYFEDAKERDGWQGQATTKSVERLKSEVTESITRLGGFVSGFLMGTFSIENKNRQGFQIHYSLSTPDGRFVPGRLDGMRFFEALSPGFAPLMPFMIANNEGKTISQLWAESPVMSNLLPPSDADFLEAEVTE